ncbi:hypothetical protein GGH92_009870, partial [Coemansia sp. RSA 2673]
PNGSTADEAGYSQQALRSSLQLNLERQRRGDILDGRSTGLEGARPCTEAGNQAEAGRGSQAGASPAEGETQAVACQEAGGVQEAAAAVGPPTPRTGPAKPGGATGMPRPAGRPTPGPAASALPVWRSELDSAGGGPSTLMLMTLSPRKITNPS